jgi:hypothetical protein
MQSPAVACREIEPPSSSAVPVPEKPSDTGQWARQFGEPGILPSVPMTLNNLGLLDNTQNRWGEARKEAEEALKIYRLQYD